MNPADFDRHYQQAYDRVHPWAMIAAGAGLPMALLWPFWWDLRSALGLEGAALISAAIQIALILALPHRISDWIARLVARRRTQ